MVAWLSGSALLSINVVTLRRARLVLGLVTVCGRVNHLGMVQQGSVLRPLLYLLYTAELALLVTRHGLNLHQYADDTQVYVSTSAKETEAAVIRLTACLVDIEAWLKASRLRLNPTKTQVMWLGSPQQLATVSISEVPVTSTVSISREGA